jgi:hypothetical protein
LGDGLHIHGNEEYPASHIGCGSCRLASGMSGPHYYNIVFYKHGHKDSKDSGKADSDEF